LSFTRRFEKRKITEIDCKSKTKITYFKYSKSATIISVIIVTVARYFLKQNNLFYLEFNKQPQKRNPKEFLFRNDIKYLAVQSRTNFEYYTYMTGLSVDTLYYLPGKTKRRNYYSSSYQYFTTGTNLVKIES
jgi:hypothetical protein